MLAAMRKSPLAPSLTAPGRRVRAR